nr:DciA family protein [Pseudaestuariivita rosea]
MTQQIRSATEKRGFAVTRLLTHWSDIVGDAVANVATPVKIRYGREGFGATLTLLTTGAQAPMLQAQLPQIRDRVNACYGYNAISQIRLTQTAPTGFAEGQAQFKPKPKARPMPSVQVEQSAKQVAMVVENDDLRAALEKLGTNILSKYGNKD